jgi:hypothetical protein
MLPLIKDMVQNDPEARPTMERVVERFGSLRGRLTEFQLSARLPKRNEFMVTSAIRDVPSLLRFLVPRWITKYL